jgi:Reverse transcriptase (RNA-dependent DNA polymerase)/Endonuclease-reverse transcriptase
MEFDPLPAHPTIITGDFNLHHPSWSNDNRALEQDQLSNTIADWMAHNSYSILNRRGEITHLARHAGEQPSTIDLSFANPEAIRLDAFKHWAVDPEMALNSDHNAIKFTLDHGLKEIMNFFPVKYNVNKTDPKDWAKFFDQEITDVDHILTPLLNNRAPTNSDLDTYAETLTAAIQNALAKAAPEHKQSKESKPWWDNDLSNATKAVSNARSAHKAYQDLTGEFGPVLQAEVLRFKNFFKRLCKFKKKAWLNKTLENASSKDLWSFPKWSRGIRNYPTPPISRGPNIPKATSHEDKCEALRKELYQPPPTLDQEFSPDTSSRLVTDLPFTDVTKEEIRDALFKNKSNSAPGHSQISYKVLGWAWGNLNGQKHITTLVQQCLRNGYHPKTWCKAVAVAIPKPNKPDYCDPRAYRLITLLECLAKLLEHVVARRLTFLAGELNLVPPNQFGGQSNSSTDDAILTFVSDVQTAWNSGKVTSALTFDIKGYFDFVNHSRLLCELRRKQVPLEYIKWTSSFLSDREAAICIDGACSDMKPVQNGIPQGSPVSPILAAFYSSELLEKFTVTPESLHPANTPSHPLPVSIIMYVDDGKIYVSSDSLYTNVILLRLAYGEVAAWLKQAGLAPDLTKRELMHYSRRRKYDCSPPISLLDDDGVTRIITADRYVKWLGVHFDRKLRFSHHTKIAASKGDNAVNSLHMLANTTRGLSHTLLRRLYLSCVIPKILYASPIWWCDTKCQAAPFEKVQRKALRLICAAFKTTPTHALEIEASVPPIKHQAHLARKRYAIRINNLPLANPVVQRLTNAWRYSENPSFLPPISTTQTKRKTKTTLQKTIALTSHTHERSDPYASPPWS